MTRHIDTPQTPCTFDTFHTSASQFGIDGTEDKTVPENRGRWTDDDEDSDTIYDDGEYSEREDDIFDQVDDLTPHEVWIVFVLYTKIQLVLIIHVF